MLDLSWNDLVPSLLQLTLVIAKTILNIAVVLAVGYAGLRLVNTSSCIWNISSHGPLWCSGSASRPSRSTNGMSGASTVGDSRRLSMMKASKFRSHTDRFTPDR